MVQPRTLKFHNGEKLPAFFTVEEMGNRLIKLREYMVSEAIDAVLFTSLHNINYFTTSSTPPMGSVMVCLSL